MKLFQKNGYSQNCFARSSPLPKASAPMLPTTPHKMHSAQQSSEQSSGTPRSVPPLSYQPTQDRRQPSSQVNQDLPFQNEPAQAWPQLLPSPEASKKQLTSSPQEAKIRQSPTKQQPHECLTINQQQYPAVEQEPHPIEQQHAYTARQQKSKQPKSAQATKSLPLSKQAGAKNTSAPQKSLKKKKRSNTAIQSKVEPPVIQLSPTASPQRQKQSPWKPLQPVVPISLQSTVTASKSSPPVIGSIQISSEHSKPLQNPTNISIGSFISPELEETLYSTVPSRSRRKAAFQNKVPISEGKDNIHFCFIFLV